MTNQALLKELLGSKVAQRVKSGQVIGLGTGTTATEAIKAIGKRIRRGEIKNISGIATSDKITDLARDLGITILQSETIKPEWGFDGADEVEKDTLNLIKGGGAAATQEKKLAKRCKEWIVIVDETKIVGQLGNFPVAIEVKDNISEKEIKKAFIALGAQKLTTHPLQKRSDLGNRLFNLHFKPGQIKPEWEQEWPEQFPWLIDSGLFMNGYPDEVWVARSNGTIEVIPGLGNCQ